MDGFKMKRIVYHVFGDLQQETTTVKLNKVENSEINLYIEDTLKKRFCDYNLRFNHFQRIVHATHKWIQYP